MLHLVYLLIIVKYKILLTGLFKYKSSLISLCFIIIITSFSHMTACQLWKTQILFSAIDEETRLGMKFHGRGAEGPMKTCKGVTLLRQWPRLTWVGPYEPTPAAQSSGKAQNRPLYPAHLAVLSGAEITNEGGRKSCLEIGWEQTPGTQGSQCSSFKCIYCKEKHAS